MSYPEERYHGDKGEISATFRPVDSPPGMVTGTGTPIPYLATGASTGGEFGLYVWNMPAQPTGPGTHFHKTISESFYILSGTVRLFNGEKWVDGTKGDFLYVPPGGLHAFRNESGEPASMLMLFTPGAPREGYFEGIAELGEMSEDERAEFFLYHDTYWT